MNAGTETLTIAGPAGAIDVALDRPPLEARAVAVIAHPHPLFGGTRDNKVVQTLARALLALGCVCWRPNFRGVGQSEGAHDDGIGETDDLLTVVKHARSHACAPSGGGTLILAGFSFGGFVQTRVARRLAEHNADATRLVLVAPAVTRYHCEPVPDNTLLIQGEEDDVIPMPAMFDWARPQSLPVVVVPGTGHFFHGRLPLLRRIVQDGLASALGRPDEA